MRRQGAIALVCGLILIIGLAPGAAAQSGSESADQTDTWAYDFNANSWTEMARVSSPSPRESAAISYDSESDRVVLFGGNTNLQDRTELSSETWTYNLNTNAWTKMQLATRPPGLGTAGMAYDAESDRIILFGGFTEGFADSPTQTFARETWAYDFNGDAWTKRSPPQSPTARSAPSMAYDAQSDRVILVGGFGGSSLFDTWAYDYNSDTWVEMNPATPPSTGDSAAIAYDSESDRVIVSSGFVQTPHGDTDESWAYDFNSNSWTNLAPPQKPSRRWTVKGAYNVEADRIVIFGGHQGFGDVALTPLGDTWAYDFNADTWRDMNPSAHPAARCCHALSYDVESDRIVLFGGRTGKLPEPGLPILLIAGAVVAVAAGGLGVLFWLRRKRIR